MDNYPTLQAPGQHPGLSIQEQLLEQMVAGFKQAKTRPQFEQATEKACGYACMPQYMRQAVTVAQARAYKRIYAPAGRKPRRPAGGGAKKAVA